VTVVPLKAHRHRYRFFNVPTSLVTGGAGFLGSHLCDYQVALGHELTCVDNLDTGSLQNIQHLAHCDDFVFVNHDLTQPLFLDHEVDYVFHLASPASPIDYRRLPLHTLKVGSYGTHHMLGVAKFRCARSLLASTSEVYRDPRVNPQSETHWGDVNPIGPRGVHDQAKRYAEAMTMAYHRQQGVDTCIARVFGTYGPCMGLHDGRAVTAFMHQTLGDEPVTVFGDGSQTRSFCHVDDLVRGLVLLAESREHSPVNLDSPVPVTLLELAEALIRVTGSRSEITYESLPVDDPRVRLPNMTRARELLGSEPEISFEDGLRGLADSASSRDGAGRGAGPSSRHVWKPVETANAAQPSD
jgi:dTDP-glucose 4,6-dehydratase